jgi:hypothetical protein
VLRLKRNTRSVIEAQHQAGGAERLAALERIEHGGLVEPRRQRLGFERGGDQREDVVLRRVAARRAGAEVVGPAKFIRPLGSAWA